MALRREIPYERTAAVLLAGALVLAGCRSFSPVSQTAPPAGNPLFVQSANHQVLWERTVGVLHDFRFQIAREDRLTGIIETHYTVGSGVLEPWRYDSVGHENRWESTLQSIRRLVRVRMTPGDGAGGYLVSVEALQEAEDLPGLAANSPGAATFQESEPLRRDLNPVVGQTTPSGWIPLGRDIALEQAILARLRAAYSG